MWLLNLSKAVQGSLKKLKKIVGTVGETVLTTWASSSDIKAVGALLASRLAASTEKRKEGEFERDSAQVLFARQVGALMALGTESSRALLAAFSALPTEVLLHVATNGQISRAILDIFFVHNADADNTSKLVNALSSLATQLACHYVGQHILRQTFDIADIKVKENIVTSLIADKDRLNRTKEGRNSLQMVIAIIDRI